jgi:ABC-type arginine transport system permease subunit
VARSWRFPRPGRSRPGVWHEQFQGVLPRAGAADDSLAIPGFTNNWLVLTKATALISVVGLQDMMFKAKQAANATREPFTFFLAVAAMYLVITSVSLLAAA